jgi:NADP-dependent 3-hydroxy acid dehydrogenase YdfG
MSRIGLPPLFFQTYNVVINKENAIPAESFARAVAFAMRQPEDVDVNEILFRPTRHELKAPRH